MTEAVRMARAKELTENEIGEILIAEAIELHRALGPGLLESVYELILAKALKDRGLAVERQVAIPIEYRGIRFEEGFRADLLIERRVLAELKSVSRIDDAHRKQILTYLRVTGLKLGYVLNFGNARLSDGITRVVNRLAETLPAE
jgi:GxxExxY protein